ncbi:cytochrome c oxidase assembly protein [Pendulispora brunnea]|uniref:Cytochrome c oxidase assembly protein n=1 Tax=Pendulispora brunnea TaxID=2905690 RepID=A0ABZ2KD30_9BACT
MCIDAREALTWWTLDPLSMGAVGLSAAGYGWGLRSLWRTVGIGHGIRPWEVACYVLGELSLLFALVSPIDRLSDLLFSAHMTQHEIILLVAPPLIVLGKPTVAFSWMLPRSRRLALGRLMKTPALLRTWRVLSAPLVILLVHMLVVWLWHIPSFFEGALRHENVHAVQHATFFATAALFWWAILRGRYGPGGYGLAVAFVFATAMHESILGALITLGSRLWYPLYLARGEPWQINVMDDQELAGLIMWVPGGVAMTLGALALFAAWLGESRRRMRALERRHP